MMACRSAWKPSAPSQPGSSHTGRRHWKARSQLRHQASRTASSVAMPGLLRWPAQSAAIRRNSRRSLQEEWEITLKHTHMSPACLEEVAWTLRFSASHFRLCMTRHLS